MMLVNLSVLIEFAPAVLFSLLCCAATATASTAAALFWFFFDGLNGIGLSIAGIHGNQVIKSTIAIEAIRIDYKNMSFCTVYVVDLFIDMYTHTHTFTHTLTHTHTHTFTHNVNMVIYVTA